MLFSKLLFSPFQDSEIVADAVDLVDVAAVTVEVAAVVVDLETVADAVASGVVDVVALEVVAVVVPEVVEDAVVAGVEPGLLSLSPIVTKEFSSHVERRMRL